jgi:hypothetical protein
LKAAHTRRKKTHTEWLKQTKLLLISGFNKKEAEGIKIDG